MHTKITIIGANKNNGLYKNAVLISPLSIDIHALVIPQHGHSILVKNKNGQVTLIAK